jgi:hypothetical protein
VKAYEVVLQCVVQENLSLRDALHDHHPGEGDPDAASSPGGTIPGRIERRGLTAMAERNPQTVAALALTYRELHNAHVLSPQDFVDDREGNPDELGLLVRAVASQMTDVDWLVLRTFDDANGSWAVVAEDVHNVDPARAEAMLHAWPPERGLPPLGAAWTFGYIGERWEAVDAAMLHLEARGLLANREDIESTARGAYVAVTGDDDVGAWIDHKLDFEESASS